MIGRIYKIIAGQTDECYVGSTFNELKYRFKGHKGKYKELKNGKSTKSCSSFKLFDKYGIESCKMILIKEYEVVDRKQLEVYETLWIKKLKSNNKTEPCGRFLRKQNKKFYSEKNMEHLKQMKKLYHEKNKDQIKQKKKLYRQNNVEQIKQRGKQHRENNIEKMKQKDKEYYQKNKEKISIKGKEKVKCEICDCEVRKDTLNRHKKTLKHKNNLNTSI